MCTRTNIPLIASHKYINFSFNCWWVLTNIAECVFITVYIVASAQIQTLRCWKKVFLNQVLPRARNAYRVKLILKFLWCLLMAAHAEYFYMFSSFFSRVCLINWKERCFCEESFILNGILLAQLSIDVAVLFTFKSFVLMRFSKQNYVNLKNYQSFFMHIFNLTDLWNLNSVIYICKWFQMIDTGCFLLIKNIKSLLKLI